MKISDQTPSEWVIVFSIEKSLLGFVILSFEKLK